MWVADMSFLQVWSLKDKLNGPEFILRFPGYTIMHTSFSYAYIHTLPWVSEWDLVV